MHITHNNIDSLTKKRKYRQNPHITQGIYNKQSKIRH